MQRTTAITVIREQHDIALHNAHEWTATGSAYAWAGKNRKAREANALATYWLHVAEGLETAMLAIEAIA